MSSSTRTSNGRSTLGVCYVLQLNRSMQTTLSRQIDAVDAELHFLDHLRLALLEQSQSQSQQQHHPTTRSRRSSATAVRALHSSPFFDSCAKYRRHQHRVWAVDDLLSSEVYGVHEHASTPQPALLGGCGALCSGALRMVRKRGIWSRRHSVDDDLLDIVERHGGPNVTFLKPYNSSVWQSVAQELRQLGMRECTARQCYLHAQSLLMTRTACTREEDAKLRHLIARHGRRDWWFIASEVHKAVGVYRTPFQLAQRYHMIMKPVMYNMHVPTEQLWHRIESLVRAVPSISCPADESDFHRRGEDVMNTQLAAVIVRVNGAAQASGELPLQLRSVRSALEYGMMLRLGERGLYWKVFNILCNIPYLFTQRLSHFAARVPSRYSQLQLSQIALQWCSPVANVRARICHQLCNSYRRFSSVSYERLSVDTFGHTCGAYVLFMEACLLSKKRSLRDIVEQHDLTVNDEQDRFCVTET